MDPITATALLAYSVGKLWAWISKEDARHDARTAQGELEEQARLFGTRSDAFVGKIEEFGRRCMRGGILERICQRAERAAEAMSRNSTKAERTSVKGMRQTAKALVAFLRKINDEVDARPELLDEKASWALRGVLVLQGVEYAEKWHLIQTPLDDSLRHLLHLPADIDGVPGIFESVLDSPLTDILSVPLLAWGLWRMTHNFSKAEEYRENAGSLRREVAKIEQRRAELEAASNALDDTADEVDEASYQAFKLAWMAEMRAKRGQSFSARFRDDFEQALDRLRAALNAQVRFETAAA